MQKFQSQDRSLLIRFASSLPKGSPEKKTILAGLGETRRTAEEEITTKAQAVRFLKSKGMGFVTWLVKSMGFMSSAKTHPSRAVGFQGGTYGEYTATNAWRTRNSETEDMVIGFLQEAGLSLTQRDGIFLKFVNGDFELTFVWREIPTYKPTQTSSDSVTYWLVLNS